MYFLAEKLHEREKSNSLRQLKHFSAQAADFSSNDYLGIARNPIFKEKLVEKLQSYPFPLGATGSRLLTGNSAAAERLEHELATFHLAEAALLFQSGYAANVGIFASIPQQGDTILYDQLVHASIRDGIRLSKATSFAFQHNDLNDLRQKLTQAKGNVFIAVESVYSMDGDLCPLTDLCLLAEAHGAHIILDEAHSTGIFGDRGEGFAVSLGLHTRIFARLHTFGKAVGYHGAAVLGSCVLRDYLVNFARPFVYSTSLPATDILGIEVAYELLYNAQLQRDQLWENIRFFEHLAKQQSTSAWRTNPSPVQTLMISGNEAVVAVAKQFADLNICALPIRYPSVPKGAERIRFCLHNYNSIEEIQQIFTCSKQSDFATNFLI